ncbi:MAG: hypothetical protein FWG71_00470 [Synergistaceae bacterium]|nr:hypothetical protein [Synergistaceae bacterium]
MKYMKYMKITGLVFLAAVLSSAVLVTGANEGKVIEIRDRMFIQQSNDVYINVGEYLGKTVRLEGIYSKFTNEDGRDPISYVYRKTPGCCGDDGKMGFMVLLDGVPAPEPDAWVEATGKVEVTERNEVALRLSSLKVMDKRGKEFVSN